MNINGSFEFETTINRELLETLFMGNSNQNETTFGFLTKKSVPKRHHKKKRIQKKWIKRYGLTEAVNKRYIVKGGVVELNKINNVLEFELTELVENE